VKGRRRPRREQPCLLVLAFLLPDADSTRGQLKKLRNVSFSLTEHAVPHFFRLRTLSLSTSGTVSQGSALLWNAWAFFLVMERCFEGEKANTPGSFGARTRSGLGRACRSRRDRWWRRARRGRRGHQRRGSSGSGDEGSGSRSIWGQRLHLRRGKESTYGQQ